MANQVHFITSNAAKVELARERLSRYRIEVIQQSLDLYEPRSLELEEVARQKQNKRWKRLSILF